jgi:hypothetical protein
MNDPDNMRQNIGGLYSDNNSTGAANTMSPTTKLLSIIIYKQIQTKPTRGKHYHKYILIMLVLQAIGLFTETCQIQN